MLYFSSEVKMDGPKKWGSKVKLGGQKTFSGQNYPLTFNLLPTPMIYHVCETVTLMY